MNDRQRVVVAMSGGVDSSVTAALLKQQGFDVVGMMLRLWSEPGTEADNRCCTPDAMAQARRVAAKLGIPFYAVDAKDTFFRNVVQYFIDGYSQGITPNPCLECNRQVRWQFLLQHALALGATHLATGHYARLAKDEEDGVFQLLRALDRSKDQSYILHVLDQEKLQHALFPLGNYTKSQVRQMARDFDLPVAERADSQDLCFLAGHDLQGFIRRNTVEEIKPGLILNRQGERLGEHKGLAFYTIGQRKGLGIAHPEPLYVLDKNITENTLIVGTKDELGRLELTAEKVNWVSGKTPPFKFNAQVKIRYRANEAPATITLLEDARIHIQFDEPVRDITPGQAAVIFDGEICLGGGIITG